MRMVSFLVIMASFCLACGAQARTWFVEKDGSGDFIVIQDALDAAASGDTVRIGPGRFEDFRQYTYPGGTPVIVANVQVANMTLIGAGQDATIIGPEVYDGPYPDPPPVGIAHIGQSLDGNLSVSGLSIENVWHGVYVEDAGTFAVSNCGFSGGLYGINGSTSYSATDCSFDNMKRGVIGYPPAQNVDVIRCRFGPMSTSAVYFNAMINGNVEDCVLEGGDSWAVGVQFEGGGGQVLRTEIRGFAFGIGLSSPQSPIIRDCHVDASYQCIKSDSEAFIAENNIFQGGSSAVFYLYTGGYSHTLRNNHILKGTGPVVKIVNHNGPAEYHLDMRDNYWGTTVADSIASWIIDGRIPQFPPLECIVDFEPFSDVPLPSEKSSMSGFKALYR